MRKALLYLFWAIVIQFVCCWAVWLVWYLIDGMSLREVARLFLQNKLHPSTNMMIAGTAVYGLVTILVFAWRKWAPVSRDYLRSRPWAMVLWCMLLACGTIIPSIWLQELLPPLPNIMEASFNGLMSSPAGYIFIGVVAPLVEEMVFRGAILRVLLSRFKSHWLAIFVSALLFMLVHGNPAQMPHALLLGILLGWLYYRTDSIFPGVVVHWVNNTIAFVAYHFYPAIDDIRLVDLFRGSQLHVWLALLFSLFILLPSLYQVYLRTKK